MLRKIGKGFLKTAIHLFLLSICILPSAYFSAFVTLSLMGGHLYLLKNLSISLPNYVYVIAFGTPCTFAFLGLASFYFLYKKLLPSLIDFPQETKPTEKPQNQQGKHPTPLKSLGGLFF